jgi:hypothetical protein
VEDILRRFAELGAAAGTVEAGRVASFATVSCTSADFDSQSAPENAHA